MTQRGRSISDVRDWVESHLGELDQLPPARLQPATEPAGTIRDSAIALRDGCDVKDFDEFDTIPAELESLLAFSEGRKI